MTCKFCGCSEIRPCYFWATVERERRQYVCAWLADGICTAPACVAQAYEEAKLVAEKAVEISLCYYPEVAEAWLHR